MKEATDPNSERYLALHFGLGKAYEDLGEYEKAFNEFKIGTGLKRAQLKYNEAEAFGFFRFNLRNLQRGVFREQAV